MHRAKGDRFVRANELPVRQWLIQMLRVRTLKIKALGVQVHITSCMQGLMSCETDTTILSSQNHDAIGHIYSAFRVSRICTLHRSLFILSNDSQIGSVLLGKL